MTERFNRAGTALLEHSRTIEQAETLQASPEVPRVLARRAFVLEVIGADAPPAEPDSLLSRARRQAEDATLETKSPFNSDL